MRSRLAVIGDPIGHSLSPAIQRAALRSAGLDWDYEAIRLSPESLAAWVGGTRRRPWRGFNITIPHKVSVVPLLDALSAAASATGAVNTVVVEDGRLTGHTTDVEGLIAALAGLAVQLPGARCVVFGAGGAAAAAVFALRASGAQVALVNRTAEHAVRVARTAPGTVVLETGSAEMRYRIERADLLINATPLGMSHLPDGSPLPPDIDLQPTTAVFDMVYGRDTALLRRARSAGCRHADGLEMLVQQAAASFRLWTGVEPNVADMREAGMQKLHERQPC